MDALNDRGAQLVNADTSHTDAAGPARLAPSAHVVDSVTTGARPEKPTRASHLGGPSPEERELLAETDALQRRELVAQWVKFIGRYDWDWYATLTYRRATSLEWADKRFRVWTHHVNRRLFGCRYYKCHRGMRWIRSTEHQRRGVVHFHALLGRCPELDSSWAVAEWRRLAGDSKVEPYRPGGAAAWYLVKKLARDGQGEIDLGGDW